MLTSPIKKRSIVIFGKKTSVSLEDEFWEAAKLIAVERKLNVKQLIEEIAGAGMISNLSSAIRVKVVDHFIRRCGDDGNLSDKPSAKSA